MDNALIAIFALLLNAALGGPRSFYEATNLVRIGRIPAKLLRDRESRFNQPGRQILLIAYALFAAFAIGVLLHYTLKGDLKFVEIAILALLLPVRPTFERAFRIYAALRAGNVLAAKQTLEGTVWKHHILLDEHGVARAAIELIAVNFCEKILNPLLWYLLFGLPGFLVCRTISLLKESLPSSFSAATHIDQLLLKFPALMLWIASRLASLLWVLSSVIFPNSNLDRTIEKFKAEAARAPSSSYILFTAATVLGLSLGGSTSAYVNTSWFGVGNPKAGWTDVKRALSIYGAVIILVFIFLGLLLG